MDADLKSKALGLVTELRRPVRLREFMANGIDGKTMRRLIEGPDSPLVSPLRGVYVRREDAEGYQMSLAVMATHDPDLLVCLRSAAGFHGLLDRAHDARLWVAVPRNARPPLPPAGTQVAVVRFQEMFPEVAKDGGADAARAPDGAFGWLDAMEPVDEAVAADRRAGVEREWVHGAAVRVTTPERTVCDLFRFAGREAIVEDSRARLAVAQDDALEALDALLRRQDLPALERMADRLGCAGLIRPAVTMMTRLRFGR